MDEFAWIEALVRVAEVRRNKKLSVGSNQEERKQKDFYFIFKKKLLFNLYSIMKLIN